MKRLLVIPLLFAALSLGACGPGSKVGQLIEAATATYDNPASKTNIYQIKNGYAATLELADQWRTYCYARPYAVLMADPIAKPLCEHRRAVVRAIQKQRPRVKLAITEAEDFVRDHPTLNAATAITAAWSTLQDFQALVPRAK